MKLYDSAAAPNPRRVRVFLAEKGIDVPTVQIDIGKAENRQPEFLAKNPMGGVPVLELDDGTFLAESVAICRYFEETNPEPRLFGTPGEDLARVEMWQRRAETQILDNTAGCFRNTNKYFKGRIEQVPAYGELCKNRAFEAFEWLDGELAAARDIQMGILPRDFPERTEFSIYAMIEPARAVGGDLYDFAMVDDDHLFFMVGDVSGKGVPAALLAANLKACLRAHVHAGADDPGETIARVNRIFWDVTPKSLFATLLFGVFDFESGTLSYVNAGHEPAIVVGQGGRTELLDAGGTVLGLFEDSKYSTGRIRVSPDDLLVLFSDGLADRSSPSGELFGADRLREVAARAYGDPVRIALYSLLGEVQGWAGGRPAEDDQTLILARVR